jgi:hypothetical protein
MLQFPGNGAKKAAGVAAFFINQSRSLKRLLLFVFYW